jgi:antitoxin ParD1/3/4
VEDERILQDSARPGENTSDTLRRALRLLDHERWLERFHADAEALRAEDLSTEADAW